MTIAATVKAMGVAIAIIMPHARTCRHVRVFIPFRSVGRGNGSGQNSGREGAMLAG
jgi:hypothetical protein